MTAQEFSHRAASSDRLERHLRAASLIASELAPLGLEPIVVGGTAVEFYTRGTYLTQDLDLVVPGFEQIARVLERLGFDRLGASFLHKELDLAVHLPPEPLEGDRKRLESVNVDGRQVSVIGLEDIIADRLRAAAYWKDLSSGEWAAQMMAAWWSELDWAYLEALPDMGEPAYAAALRMAQELAARVVAGTGPAPDGSAK